MKCVYCGDKLELESKHSVDERTDCHEYVCLSHEDIVTYLFFYNGGGIKNAIMDCSQCYGAGKNEIGGSCRNCGGSGKMYVSADYVRRYIEDRKSPLAIAKEIANRYRVTIKNSPAQKIVAIEEVKFDTEIGLVYYSPQLKQWMLGAYFEKNMSLIESEVQTIATQWLTVKNLLVHLNNRMY